MIVLDTNVLSAVMRERPDERVLTWLDEQARTSVWTTSITILEIRFGLEILPEGRRRLFLMKAFERVLADDIVNRVANFDRAAAEESAQLMARRHKKGRPVDLRDTMIAGIAVSRHAALATRNISHFDDLTVPVINPWQD
jgi:toxin FitB